MKKSDATLAPSSAASPFASPAQTYSRQSKRRGIRSTDSFDTVGARPRHQPGFRAQKASLRIAGTAAGSAAASEVHRWCCAGKETATG